MPPALTASMRWADRLGLSVFLFAAIGAGCVAGDEGDGGGDPLATTGDEQEIIGRCGAAGCASDEGDADGDPDAAAGDTPTADASRGRCASTEATRTGKVKIMTANVRHDADQWERRFPLIADEIARLDPDIIGLQEVKILAGQAKKLNDLLAARGHARYHVYEKLRSGFGFFTGEGVAIMSRWPMLVTQHEDMAPMRTSILARIQHPSGPIDMIDTHLEHRAGAEYDQIRVDQVKETLGLMARNDACHPQFLTGDMNGSDGSPAVKELFTKGFVDSYRAVHGANTPKTGKTAMIKLADGAFEQAPTRRIDFVLARGAGDRTATPIDSVVCFKNHDARGFYPSDHLGVMTTFQVRF